MFIPTASSENKEIFSAVNSNWQTDKGAPDGGVSFGAGFTISWQRGNIDQEGRNGAFLTSVLNACLVRLNYNQNKISCSENVAAIECITNAISHLNKRQTRHYNEKVLDTHKSNAKTICNSYSIINTDEELKMAESWLDKFKNALEIIDAENNPKLPLAEKYISKIQKDKYKTKIAEFEYNINTYKNSVNQNKP